MKDTRVAILGAGQIGSAVYRILSGFSYNAPRNRKSLYGINSFVIDSNEENLRSLEYGSHVLEDLSSASVEDISVLLREQSVTHVINSLPFTFNEKVASAAAAAGCSYIDFTEDDAMADKVQAIYKDTELNCAVKCGLAPGFINYIGYDLVGKIDTPDSLLISVGALPRNVSFDASHPEYSYNLTWSVDGLVNEYIRPCRVRRNGVLEEVPALDNLTKVVLDGVEYEAAYTSGGVGSLARDLENVPNIAYMTLRYPGHYRFVRATVQENHGNFDKIKAIFQKKFPYTDDDVIVVYANAHGQDANGKAIRRSYSNRFYGVDGLTAIQSTTASAGVAVLELMLLKRIKGIIDQTDVPLEMFTATQAFGKYYRTSK